MIYFCKKQVTRRTTSVNKSRCLVINYQQNCSMMFSPCTTVLQVQFQIRQVHLQKFISQFNNDLAETKHYNAIILTRQWHINGSHDRDIKGMAMSPIDILKINRLRCQQISLLNDFSCHLTVAVAGEATIIYHFSLMILTRIKATISASLQ